MPPPEDFRVDFFCVGAQKGRSTWLAACLRDHPDIAVSRLKETNHFVETPWLFTDKPNPRFERGWDWYMHEFEHARPGQVLGDMSVAMFQDPGAPARVHGYFPDARIIMCLRDPVARTYSHYWQRAWNPKLPAIAWPVEEAVLQEEMLRASRYHAQYQAWRQYFPDRIHVITDFQIDADPLGAIQGVYRFLGVDADVEPAHLTKVVHQSGRDRRLTAKARRVGKALQRSGMGVFVRLAKALRVDRAVVRLNRKAQRYPPLPADIAASLYQALRDDLDAFEEATGIDVSPWHKYASLDLE